MREFRVAVYVATMALKSDGLVAEDLVSRLPSPALPSFLHVGLPLMWSRSFHVLRLSSFGTAYNDLHGVVQVEFSFGVGPTHPLSGARHSSRGCFPPCKEPPIWLWLN
jgi:hypothetical protein